ncbi:MAG TPA: hypothetical protein VN158_12495 [Caulobacter sp.]|nr:hypothetical protein [Caulobacter sp.]
MTLTPLHLRLRNVPVGSSVSFNLHRAREARFVLGQPAIGLRFILPAAGEAFTCNAIRLDPNALMIRFAGAVSHLTVVAYVDHSQDHVGGRAILPLGADLQILTAHDLQSVIGDTSWFVKIADADLASPAAPPAGSAPPTAPSSA